MIEIRMNTARFKLTVKGHATAEETGEWREVCSAVSALAQALAWSITKYDGMEKGALKSVEYRPDSGDLLLRVWPESWAEIGMRHRYRIYGDGLEMLALAHPESVHMIWDDEEIQGQEGQA